MKQAKSWEDRETIERNIRYLAAGARASERFRLVKFVEDQ